MLSKEEKLKYGEMLRQQMKEKQDRKRHEDMAKRGAAIIPPINKVQSDKVFLVQPTYNVDPKEVLQKKLETQDYNPFGKAGGGAPNLKSHQNITVNSEGNYSGLVMNNQQQYPQRHPQLQPQVYNGQDYNHPQQIRPQKYNNQYQMIKNQSYRYPEQVQQLQQYQRSANDYPIKQQNYQQHPQKYQEYPHQVQTIKIPVQYQPEQIPRGYQEQVRYVQPPPHYQQVAYSLPTNPRVGQVQRVRTLQNEQMQEMYKRGGRNLLKLQNETVNQHLVKQKQKLQMQAFLKQQMEQAQHRKQLQKQKLKREQMEQERRNRQYIQQQNQKLRDQERKKNEQKQKIIEDNLKSLAKRKQLQQEAKDKLQRERLIQIQNQRKRGEQDKQRERDRQRQQHGIMSKMSREQQGRISREGGRMSRQGTSSLNSTSSQNTTQGKGFNTDISRQFFRKQREKQPQKFRNDKKLQMFTNEIQKMRDQINNQGEMFSKEIERIKKQSQLALIEKKKAEYQIEKLKLQLQKKNRQVELKLIEALKRNDPYSYPKEQYQDSLAQLERTEQFRPQQKQYVPPTPPKMPKSNKVQQYLPQPLRERPVQNPQKQSKKALNDEYQPRRLDESQVMTLEADSKKIPLSIGGNSKLTMSTIQHYGKDSLYYQQSRVQPKNYYKQEPIMEQMQQSRVKSRKSQRGIDQLDKFVDSRQNKRWEMSTVKDDITKEIQDLLKKKENKQNGHTPIGQAGRQVLSRGGLPYQGNLNTLSSNKISAVSNGTFDVDRVYDRNEARLRQLKALGVETVNTNNDEDLNRLNDLLKHYQ